MKSLISFFNPTFSPYNKKKLFVNIRGEMLSSLTEEEKDEIVKFLQEMKKRVFQLRNPDEIENFYRGEEAAAILYYL